MEERWRVFAYEKDRDLSKLLKAWIESVRRYQRVFPGDKSWWYNERATLSTLAGAAWSLPGWIALEEFSTKKRGKIPSPSVESGELRPGRCDLLISNQRLSYAIEAKQAWQRIGRNGSGLNTMRKAQRAAWHDCWYLKGESNRRLAVTFVVPTIRMKQAQGDRVDGICQQTVDEIVQRWLEDCGDFSSTPNRRTSYAWIFPKQGKHVQESRAHFPGVVMILEEMLDHTTRPPAP